MILSYGRPWLAVSAAAFAVALATSGTAAHENASQGQGRPRLTVRANPIHGFAPQRVVFTAELAGGANDFRDYYCASVEWVWADDTRSSNTFDCDPYEPGKSEIRRRFSQDHLYREPGTFEVTFRLLQGTKVVTNARVMIEVRGLPADDPQRSSAALPDLERAHRGWTLESRDDVDPFRVQGLAHVGFRWPGLPRRMRVIDADDLHLRRPAA